MFAIRKSIFQYLLRVSCTADSVSGVKVPCWVPYALVADVCLFPTSVCLLIFPLTLRGLWEPCEMHLAHQSLRGSHPISAAAFEWVWGWLSEMKAITWTWLDKKRNVLFFFSFPHQEAFISVPTKHDVTLIAFSTLSNRTSFQIKGF